MTRIWVQSSILVGFALFLVGCGAAGSDTAKASGKVTVAGQPMADIIVTTTPESGRPASGITDAGGNFTLTTSSKGDGAVPGKHTVAFQMNSTASSGSSTAALPFNAKYKSSDTSGITAEIVDGKDNVLGPWDLEK